MPELPEVQTIVSDLRKILPGLKIIDVFSEWKSSFKNPSFEEFKKKVSGKKILSVERVGKNILINLDDGQTILIHQKMTGHLLYGKWKSESGKWISEENGPLKDDPQNRFIRTVFELSDGRQLALSDLRKFAKIILCPAGKLSQLKDIKYLGPDPTEKNFDFKVFLERLNGKKGRIKTILMDQNVFSGIGNIYSDEILWLAGVHPMRQTSSLSKTELNTIYDSIKKILNKAIVARGTSDSDYRDPYGRKGKYQEMLYVYGLDKKSCQKKDGGIIARIKIGGRSAHYCPVHQKI